MKDAVFFISWHCDALKLSLRQTRKYDIEPAEVVSYKSNSSDSIATTPSLMDMAVSVLNVFAYYRSSRETTRKSLRWRLFDICDSSVTRLACAVHSRLLVASGLFEVRRAVGMKIISLKICKIFCFLCQILQWGLISLCLTLLECST